MITWRPDTTLSRTQNNIRRSTGKVNNPKPKTTAARFPIRDKGIGNGELNVVQIMFIGSIYVHYLHKCTKLYCIFMECQIILKSTLIDFLPTTYHK